MYNYYLSMNNFQLNNTSVYLGGQCKWDIIISKRDGQLVIDGFQLTPLSNNVSFNKKGSYLSGTLNHDHSYTIKEFYQKTKESFWSTTPCFDQHTRDDNEDVTGIYDDSTICGAKRAASYQLYNKQFEYLQPVWFEKLGDGEDITFRFKICSPWKEGDNRQMERNVLSTIDLKLTKKDGHMFNNNFIDYLNNWLKYIGVMSVDDAGSGIKGNDSVLYIDLQNKIAQIKGISLISGQNSDIISCDYITDTLLQYERPTIETDYIISTIFKQHNAIVSQLFNFNFCFNINDIVDPFFMNQLSGKPISIDCDVIVGDEVLEKRSLLTNYEFVHKAVFDPFIFVQDCDVDDTGYFTLNYSKNYDPWIYDNPSFNVLDYLKEPQIDSINKKNRLTQPILHWGFNHQDKNIFNLYKGYCGLNSYYPSVGSTNIQRTQILGKNPVYQIKLFDYEYINGVNTVRVNSDYNSSNGALNWMYPGNVLFLSNIGVHETITIKEILYDKILKYINSDSSVLKNIGRWDFKNSELYGKMIKTYNEDDWISNPPYLSFIYLNTNDVVETPSPSSIKSIINQISGYDAKVIYNDNSLFIIKIKYDNYCQYLIFTNSMENFSMSILSNITTEGRDVEYEEFFKKLSDLVDDVDEDLNFYGFGTELEIGMEDEKYCYYKADSKKTYVYRKCGKLVPFLTDDIDSNYRFYLEPGTNNIVRMTPEDTEYTFENKEYYTSKILILSTNMSFTIEKSINDRTKLTDDIREKIKEFYHIEDDKLTDYIYGLYDIMYDYEYKSLDDINNIIYEIKMELK